MPESLCIVLLCTSSAADKELKESGVIFSPTIWTSIIIAWKAGIPRQKIQKITKKTPMFVRCISTRLTLLANLQILMESRKRIWKCDDNSHCKSRASLKSSAFSSAFVCGCFLEQITYKEERFNDRIN